MPNWCDNTLYLKNKDKAQLERAFNAAKEGQLLEEFRPVPKKLQNGIGWYNWCVTNWGTKWDIDLIDTDYVDENTLGIYFNSAWSPPVAWYDYMTEQGFEIEAYYNEPGLCFCGSYNNENGEDYYEYDTLDISNIPEELKEMYDLENYIEELKEYEAENNKN